MDTHNPPDPSCVRPFGGPLHSPTSTAAEDQAFALAPKSDSIPAERLRPDRRPAKQKTPLELVVAAIAEGPSIFDLLAKLVAWPRGKQDHAARSCDLWLNYFTGIERGCFIKGRLPELCDHEVAALALVARETLVKDQGYQGIKRFHASHPLASSGKYRGRRRQPIEPLPDGEAFGGGELDSQAFGDHEEPAA